MTEPRSYPHFAHTGAVRGPNAGHDSSIQTNFLKQHFTKVDGELLDDGAYTSHIHGKRHHQHQNVLTPAGDKRLLSYFANQRLPLSMNPISLMRPIHATRSVDAGEAGSGKLARRYAHSERSLGSGRGSHNKAFAKGHSTRMYASTYAQSYHGQSLSRMQARSATGWPGATVKPKAGSRWTQGEEARLTKALSMYGDMYGWSRIAHMVGTKSESACRVKAGQRQAEQQEEELMV